VIFSFNTDTEDMKGPHMINKINSLCLK